MPSGEIIRVRNVSVVQCERNHSGDARIFLSRCTFVECVYCVASRRLAPLPHSKTWYPTPGYSAGEILRLQEPATGSRFTTHGSLVIRIRTTSWLKESRGDIGIMTWLLPIEAVVGTRCELNANETRLKQLRNLTTRKSITAL